MSASIILDECYKTYTLDQDKARAPWDTVSMVREKMARAGLDLLQETERIDNGRLGIPVYISRCGADALKVMPTRKQMGKGATAAQAEASAVMEMVERFSFFHFIRHEPFVQGTYDQVCDRAMPFQQIAASVHHDPDDLGRARQAMSGLTLSWTPAYNLTRGREMLIPLNWFYEINEFNGPAAGNTLEEAIIQGLCEVVERHVSALISRQKLMTPSIDPAGLTSATARELVEKFERQGIRLYLKDFSLDMGLPTVGALAYDPATFPDLSEIVFTAGTAPDPEKALIRAVTEVAQLSGDFNTRANFVASGLPKYTDLAQAAYITGGSEVVGIRTLPNISSDNLKLEIETAVYSLANHGFEVYAVNITHPRLGVPAVYIIVPGALFRERAVAASVPLFAAKILTGQGDPAAVAQGLKRIREVYPESYYLNFYEARALLARGLPRQAAPLLVAALHMNPPQEDLAGILTYLGEALKDLEDYDRAIEVLSRSAALDDERRDTFNLLGFCFFKNKEYEKAISAFERVLQLDPGSGLDHANLGTNYRELGRIEEAVGYYRTALELDPSLEWVREKLAVLEK
jgi:ribosomal protein S12 methylthiotransferase accessory factor